MEPMFVVIFTAALENPLGRVPAQSPLFSDYKRAKLYFDACSPENGPQLCVVTPYALSEAQAAQEAPAADPQPSSLDYLRAEADKGNPNAARPLARLLAGGALR